MPPPSCQCRRRKLSLPATSSSCTTGRSSVPPANRGTWKRNEAVSWEMLNIMTFAKVEAAAAALHLQEQKKLLWSLEARIRKDETTATKHPRMLDGYGQNS